MVDCDEKEKEGQGDEGFFLWVFLGKGERRG